MEESYYVDWVKVCWNQDFYERCKKIFPIRVYGESRNSSVHCIDLSRGYWENLGGSCLLVDMGDDELPSIYSTVYMEIPKEVREIFTDLRDYVEQEFRPKWTEEEDFWAEYKYQF